MKKTLPKRVRETFFVKKRIPKWESKWITPLGLKKPKVNPIIESKPQNGWECWQTFNPGTILVRDRIHFLYRAIGNDGISRLGYASSKDGFIVDERLPYAVYEHNTQHTAFSVFSYSSGGSWGGVEDPRIVRVDDEDTLYMTYTACDNGLRVAITSISVDDFLNKIWHWEKPALISPPDEVHKNWVIFPDKINGKYAILHSITPEISIDYFDSLDFDGTTFIKSYYADVMKKNCWEGWTRGVGAPPLKTTKGWLVFYHGMSVNDFSKYKVGAMLLDLDNPAKVIARSPEPVLEPDQEYENNGFKGGVVYVSGAVIKDGTLLVYYGGADSCVCVAYADLDTFLDALRKEGKPKLRGKRIKLKK